MRTTATSIIAGVLFALGLGLGGMTQPSKIIGFLDFFGDWDPSLMFVMGGALLVNGIAYRLSVRREKPLFAVQFHMPTRRELDARLIGGAALFGIGWGLSGFCPGPGLTSLSSISFGPVAFVLSMIAGMTIFSVLERARARH